MLKCRKCGTTKNLNRHSLTGNHLPPFVPLCRTRHDLVHDIKPRPKFNKKFQPGTLKSKKKKWQNKNVMDAIKWGIMLKMDFVYYVQEDQEEIQK